MANSHSLIKSPFKLSVNAYGVYIIKKNGGLCIWDYDSRYLTRERIERGIYRVDNLKRNFRFSQQVNGD